AFGRIEDVPPNVRSWPAGIRSALALSASLESHRYEAALFKVLATLRLEAPVSADVDGIRRHRGSHRGTRPGETRRGARATRELTSGCGRPRRSAARRRRCGERRR